MAPQYLFLYRNSCPHTGETLDPMGGSVAGSDGLLLTCQRHAAQFITRSGECVGGPCQGEQLQAVPFTLSQGDLYLDEEKRFYGPVERRILLSGFLRLAFWQQAFATNAKKVEGNLTGDGTLLGSVFVLGPAKKDDEFGEVLYEHREGYFGDHSNMTEVREAVEKIVKGY